MKHEREPLVATIGDKYQSMTKYRRGALGGGPLDWLKKPDVYKRDPAECRRVALPAPETTGGPGLWEVVARRRSRRRFTGDALALTELSQVLWACQGITARVKGFELRAAPSAGALYPLETYVFANRVDSLEAGLYHYAVPAHELVELKLGDLGPRVAAAALDQAQCAEAQAVLAWTAVVERSKWKYRQRAYRYLYLDAGHVGHAVALAAEALGLGSCALGALYDEEVNRLLGAEGHEETILYLTTLGRPQ